ncbi:caspase family protein [Streptomyces sp. CA2R106]|uniref:caspase family protein n=1 Tax=Streptomyces sp. CA2R106 TaxID=3120153 RepID=UPI00300902B4
MGSIHAFMTGVNAYPAAVATPLTGCVNDVTEATRLLADRTGGTARVRTLLDGAVTVAAVEDGIRSHLGAAAAGDTALFWFSGHGTDAPASGADLLVEATGRTQALVCADGPLPDKRLGALLDEVAARGVHVLAVLDCCYSGGATRDGAGPAGSAARFAPPRPQWRRALAAKDMTLPERTPGHLLLAASRLDQVSYEGDFGGRRHGVFTYALLDAVRAAEPGTPYRQLMALAEARVRRSGHRQRPVLHPEGPGAADLPFLGGADTGPAGDHLLRYGADGWEVDCGTGHGLRDGAGADGTEFTVVAADGPDGPAGAGSGRVLRARAVRADRTLVDPVDWAPERERAYPVVLSALASAPATVEVVEDARTEGQADARPGLAERLAAALAGSGPGNSPTPLLRLTDTPPAGGAPHFRVVADRGGTHVRDRAGTPLVAPLPRAADPRTLADCLTHLAGWHRLRDFTSRPSPLDNRIRVDVVPWDTPDGPPLLPDGRGEIVCSYSAPDGERPREPWVAIRLHNRGHRPLWCVLLDLTDSYAANSALFPGHFIGPGRTGHALDGDPVQLSLPPGRPAVPGAQVRDWLKLIVAEGELNTVPFHMAAWDPERTAEVRGPSGTGRQPWAAGALRFEHPGRPGAVRDAGRVGGGGPVRWATRTIALRTVVPREATGPGA